MLFVVKMHEVYHEGHEGHEEVAIRFIAHRGTEGTEGRYKAESGKRKLENEMGCGRRFFDSKSSGTGDSSGHLQTGLRVAR